MSASRRKFSLLPLKVHIILGGKHGSPCPSIFSKGLYHIAVTADGIRVYARLPFISHQDRAVHPHLRILVRIDVDGHSRAVIAAQPVAAPAVSADALDGELLRSIVDLCKNGLHLVRDAAEDLDLICASRLLAVFQPSYRDLHPYHFCLGCLRRGICRDPVILCVYLVPAFLCSETVILVHS